MAKEVPRTIMEKELRLDVRNKDSYQKMGAYASYRFKLTEKQERVMQVGLEGVTLPASNFFFDSEHSKFELHWNAYSARRTTGTKINKSYTSYYQMEINLAGYGERIEDQNIDGLVNYLNWAMATASLYGHATKFTYTDDEGDDKENGCLIPQVYSTGEKVIFYMAIFPKMFATYAELLTYQQENNGWFFFSKYRKTRLNATETNDRVLTYMALLRNDSLNRVLGLNDANISYEVNPKIQKGYDYAHLHVCHLNDAPLINEITNADESITTDPPEASEVQYSGIIFDTSVPADTPLLANNAATFSRNPKITKKNELANMLGIIAAMATKRSIVGAFYSFMDFSGSGIFNKLKDADGFPWRSNYLHIPNLIAGNESVRVNHGLDTIYVVSNDLPVSQRDIFTTNNKHLDNLHILGTLTIDRFSLGENVINIDTKFSFKYLPFDQPRNIVSTINIGLVAYLGAKNGYKFISLDNENGLIFTLKLYKEYVGQ